MRFVSESGAIIEQHAWVDPEAAFARFADSDGAIWFDSASALTNTSASAQALTPENTHPLARYSFIAHAPYRRFTLLPEHAAAHEEFKADIKNFCGAHVDLWHDMPASVHAVVPPFRGGIAGIIGYDFGAPAAHTSPAPLIDKHMPLMDFGAYANVLAFDHTHKTCFIIATGLPDISPAPSPAKRADAAHAAIATWRQALAGLPHHPLPNPAPTAPNPTINATISKTDYCASVQSIINHILAGDIFQANFSQRFQGTLCAGDNAFRYYQRLRRLSPTPFAAYGCFGDWRVACASPERFMAYKDFVLETRPIKGTRPRGTTAHQDEAQRAALLASDKDRAENIMIVDLLRNDMAKTCADNSIKVGALCRLESFAHVHHLVSVITGRLRDDKTALDALLAAFPGGSITGAPKPRAQTLIAAHERTPRGASYGTIGYIGFDGVMDSNIIIRTAFIKARALHFHVGGGIVADSQPDDEYNESLNKARALIEALGMEALDEKQAAASRP